MPKLSLKAGTTSYIAQVFIQDSSSTIGAGLTGLAFNSGSLTAYFHRDTDTTATAITLVTMTVGTFTSSGFKEIDATNMPGCYQLCAPNTALAAGAKGVMIMLKGATNMAQLPLEIELTAVDNQDGVRAGLTALPNAAAEAAGGLYTRGTGAGQIAQDANGNVRVNVDTIKTNAVVNGGTITFPTTATLASTTNITAGTIATVTNLTNAPTAGDFTATMKTSIGTAVAASAVASVTARVTANTDQLAGQTVTAAAGVTFPTSVSSPTNITAGTITTVTNLTNAPTAGDLTATMKTSVTTAATAATPVAASVSGAVGSVTGNVGGNVTGTVGSVVGAVGSVTGAVGSVTAGCTLTAGERTSVADALLDRDMSTGADSGSPTVRTTRQALRFLRNHWTISAGTLTVKKEDDTTTSWTGAVTQTAGNPVSEIDPA